MKKKCFRRFSPVLLAGTVIFSLLFLAGCNKLSQGDFTEENINFDVGINVKAIESIPSDFAMGMDVSTFWENYKAGAKYYDWEGNELDEQGFFDFLSSNGINYIRLRVWNNPYDADGNPYGGGNCDMITVLKMAKLATNAGMKVYINFHYSDFWADPGKQKLPKAWEGMTVEKKADALYLYTYESLKLLAKEGVDIGMVQLGNENTNGNIAGSKGIIHFSMFLRRGIEAVRTVEEEFGLPKILTVVHFTNPEKQNYIKYADALSNNGVDYDVFASSYYPFWHGTLENLTSKLKDVADKYDKLVIVAETSYAYTLDDGDGFPNVISNQSQIDTGGYPASVQGQADLVCDMVQAVLNAGPNGIGVFWWESAWTPVAYAYNADAVIENEILEENQNKWNEGSGWATKYAVDYDKNATLDNYGGSGWDNQAMFDFWGYPLDSLKVWKYISKGTTMP